MSELCFIDVETTGALFGYHEIIELGAIRTTSDGSQVLSEYNSKFMPRWPDRLTKRARDVNGYSQKDWQLTDPIDASSWHEIIAFWAGCSPVCHNPSFDRAFISLSIYESGIESLGLDYHWIGTESLAFPLYFQGKINKLSLSSIADFYNLSQEPKPHRALEGARLCRSVFCKLLNEF